MFSTIFEALYLGVFVGLTSYALYSWSHKGGHADADGNVKRRPKRDKTTGKKQERETGHFAIDKWLKFGGGYYGTVALMKFLLSEFGQAFAFVTDWEGMVIYFKNFGIGSIVSFFINQLETFIQAIIWPVGYFGSYGLLELIILFAFTYSAYRWAQDYARMKHLPS